MKEAARTTRAMLLVILALLALFSVVFLTLRTPVGVHSSATTTGQSQTTLVSGEHMITAVFDCDGGRSITAVFVNGPHSKVQLTLSDGRQITLPQTISGSGARYANADESFVFWNKGNTAFITENGTTTYSGCAFSVMMGAHGRD